MKNDITILDIIENEDGSATLNIELTESALQFFIQEGFISVFRKGMELIENEEK